MPCKSHNISHCGKNSRATKMVQLKRYSTMTKKRIVIDGMIFTAKRKEGEKFYTVIVSGHGDHDGVYKYCGRQWLDYNYEDRDVSLGCPKCHGLLTQAFVHNIDEPEDDEEDGCPFGCDIRGVTSFYCKRCCDKRHSPF